MSIHSVPSYLRKVPGLRKIVNRISINVSAYKYKRILSNNEEIQDKYKGKRCFIIGNGPSLATQDISVLKDEYTFVVNNFMLTPLYDVIEPKFYCISDSNFFREEENPILFNNIKLLSQKKHKPTIFFPVMKRAIVDKWEFMKDINIYYFLSDFERSKLPDYKLTRFIPRSFNVVNYALFIALGMGFSEIYLLGTDMTGVLNIYDETGEQHGVAGHFYQNQKSEELKKHEAKLIKVRNNEIMLSAYSKAFFTFRITKEYADSKGIKIINLTPRGALDVFPLGKLENVLNNEKTKKNNK